MGITKQHNLALRNKAYNNEEWEQILYHSIELQLIIKLFFFLC